MCEIGIPCIISRFRSGSGPSSSAPPSCLLAWQGLMDSPVRRGFSTTPPEPPLIEIGSTSSDAPRVARAAEFAAWSTLRRGFNAWRPSSHAGKLTERQRRGMQGVQRRRAQRLAAAVLVEWHDIALECRIALGRRARASRAVMRACTKRRLRRWRDVSRRTRRAERAVTFSVLAVVRGRACTLAPPRPLAECAPCGFWRGRSCW